jgi:hypothetical protein
MLLFRVKALYNDGLQIFKRQPTTRFAENEVENRTIPTLRIPQSSDFSHLAIAPIKYQTTCLQSVQVHVSSNRAPEQTALVTRRRHQLPSSVRYQPASCLCSWSVREDMQHRSRKEAWRGCPEDYDAVPEISLSTRCLRSGCPSIALQTEKTPLWPSNTCR